MAKLSELRDSPDDLQHTPRRLLGTINRLLEWEQNPDGPFGFTHEYAQRALLETIGLYPYRRRPYSFRCGEPTWQRRYADSGIFVDEQLRTWLLADVETKILDLCERYNVPAPVCEHPDESPAAVLLRLKAWCLKHARGSTPADTASETTGKPLPIDAESKALGVLVRHPTWSNKQIAEAAGIHPKSLPRFEKFKKAREALKEAGKEIIRKHQDDDTLEDQEPAFE